MRLLLFSALVLALVVPVAQPAGAGFPVEEIQVTTAADVVDGGDGETSLREAFAEAEADASGSRIVLDTTTYELVCQGGGDAHLLHDVDEPLLLIGNGATIDQTCAGHSVIEDSGPQLTAEALIVTGGSSTTRAAVQTGTADFVQVRIEGNTGAGGVKLWTEDATSFFYDSIIRGNSTTLPGSAGVYAYGDLELVGTMISENTSTAALNSSGGVTAVNIDAIDSTIGPSNEGPTGGMEAFESVDLRLSTVVGNSSTGSVGGVLSYGAITVQNAAVVANRAVTQSGGLRSLGLLTLDHATVVANEAPEHANMLSTGGIDIRASVVAEPRGGGNSCAVFAGGFTSRGRNLLDPVEVSCTDPSSTTDLSGDPVLGPLRDNGPTVETLFPLAGSPLVDAIPAGECTETVDQRDIARPFGPGCDIGAVEQVYPPHAFGDVPAWVDDAVRWITSTVNDPPLMTGITPSTFRPNQAITRAQVVRMLHREAGSPDVSGYPDHGFTDVPPWVEDAVRWATAEGIATGYPNDTFRPDDPITRAQVVRMKHRLAGSPDPSGYPAHGFPDSLPWFEDALRWAANTDNPLPLITGYADDTFRPELPITRAQVVRMDYRLALTPSAWDDPDGAPSTVPFQFQN